jgi:hypothetical protein
MTKQDWPMRLRFLVCGVFNALCRAVAIGPSQP